MARQTSRSTFVRRPGAAALAVVVTFGLFYVMQALSAVHEVAIVEPADLQRIELASVREETPPEPRDTPPIRLSAMPAPPTSSPIATVAWHGSGPRFEIDPLPPSGHPGPTTSTDHAAIRVFCPSPNYPERQSARGVGGWVHLEFDVNRAGSVENPRVLDSEPPQVFDRAALKAASRCRFLPQKVDDAPVPSFNVPLVFSFDPTEQEEIR